MTRSRIRSLTLDGNARKNAILQGANLPRRHTERSEAEPRGEKWAKARDLVLGRLGSGFLIGLLGPRGTGKTQIAVEASLGSAIAGRDPLYVKAMDIFYWLRRARVKDSPLADFDLLADFMSPRLLVIDELGERGETDWEDRTLVYLIDKRYDAMHDTLLIANMTESAFRESLGPSIADRLRECGGYIPCDWQSFRRTKT